LIGIAHPIMLPALMEIGEVIALGREGKFEPVHVLTGTERFLIERAIGLLRSAAVGNGIPGFNDDVFHGRGLAAATVIATARTIPMMASSRFVLVREVEHMAAEELAKLGQYVADPVPSACVVLVAEKLDARTALVKAAKAKGRFTEAKELRTGDLRSFVSQEAKARGVRIDSHAASALVDAIGNDLAALDDAMERLSLFVAGPAAGASGASIDVAAVEACITRVRTESVWVLVDSLSARDRTRALGATASLLGDREPPLRIVSLAARQMRMLAKAREALAEGLGPTEAAQRAGAPPFKARELADAAKRFGWMDLANAFLTLAETDLELKGSYRPDSIVLEEAIVRLTASGRAPRYKEVLADRRRR
jgi:DNA polymerase-3 subunit delta